jgi:hypothetical protein
MAWQHRMPAAAQLLQPCMLPRHVHMLLALQHIAEGGSIDSFQASVAQRACSSQQQPSVSAALSDARVQPSGPVDTSGGWEPHELQHALLHYGLMRQDGYEAALMQNSSPVDTHGAMPSISGELPPQLTGPSNLVTGPWQVFSVSNSLAGLLVWLTRCPATQSFLARVLEIARGEQALLQKVCSGACIVLLAQRCASSTVQADQR